MTDVIDAGQAALTGIVDDGHPQFDAPIRDTLRRLGYLTDDQAQRATDFARENGVDIDQAALDLGFISPDDLDRAREQLINSLALHSGPTGRMSDELIVISDPSGLRAEAIRLLRTQIIAQHIKPGRRALAVTAPVDGAGCSSVTANLAVALSQVGIKTLLVDANLRSPRIDQFFGIDAHATGLTSYLTLEVPRPERVVNANVLPSLSIITAGPPVGRPQELLSSSRFRDGLNILLREFDIALFDTSPGNTSADSLSVAAAVGYALIVARRDHTHFRDVATLAGQLAAARATVIGSVLNEF